MKKNLYRIDDVLLRAGIASALLGIAVAALVVLVRLASGNVDGRGSFLSELLGLAPVLALGSLCPAALLTAGISLRRREKQIVAIWNLLEQNAEISAPGLIANSDFERRDLERAVRFLNNRGLGHYLWDRRSDTIQDARLLSSQLHVETCDACGAKVALDVPLGFHGIPKCPHCGDPVCAESLDERRREAIESLRAEHRPAKRERPQTNETFSLPLFAVLLVVCWPAAILYAVVKWQGGR